MSSKLVSNGSKKTASRLVKSVEAGLNQLKDYTLKPDGVFGSVAKIMCGGVTLDSKELDLEFVAPFDDDLEPNEAEITVYNLSPSTVNHIEYRSEISIEAGYTGDTGVVFKGYVNKVTTKLNGADRVTTIKCIDSVSSNSLQEITYKAGTKASYILRDLLKKTGTPIAVFSIRRDWTYKDEQKVDGDLMENIKKFSQVCGVSTYINKGRIFCRYIKDGDDLLFTVSEETGLIGSPEPYQEEVTAEDYKDVINGYEAEMLFQHRITAGAIINLKSVFVNGTFRACSGEHRFNPDECITKVKMY